MKLSIIDILSCVYASFYIRVEEESKLFLLESRGEKLFKKLLS